MTKDWRQQRLNLEMEARGSTRDTLRTASPHIAGSNDGGIKHIAYSEKGSLATDESYQSLISGFTVIDPRVAWLPHLIVVMWCVSRGSRPGVLADDDESNQA